jgi:DNA-binding NarL/FixJ family response regulator
LTDVLKLATSLGARGFKRLICISDETGAAYLQHLITLGVLGLLTGECSTAELKLAIESVGLGRAYASPEVVRALMQRPQRKPGSPLEKSAVA